MEEMWLCRINKQVDSGYFVYTEYFGSSWQCSLTLLRPVYSPLLDFIVSLGFYGFSSSHVWMWELDYKESWVLKSWCFELHKEIHPVHPKGDQSWEFIGRTDAEAETPVLWPPHEKSWLIEKDSDAGRDWGQEGKGTTENEMAGWHHWLDGHEFGCTPGVGDRQVGLTCCDSWGHKESDRTELLNWSRSNSLLLCEHEIFRYSFISLIYLSNVL